MIRWAAAAAPRSTWSSYRSGIRIPPTAMSATRFPPSVAPACVVLAGTAVGATAHCTPPRR